MGGTVISSQFTSIDHSSEQEDYRKPMALWDAEKEGSRAKIHGCHTQLLLKHGLYSQLQWLQKQLQACETVEENYALKHFLVFFWLQSKTIFPKDFQTGFQTEGLQPGEQGEGDSPLKGMVQKSPAAPSPWLCCCCWTEKQFLKLTWRLLSRSRGSGEPATLCWPPSSLNLLIKEEKTWFHDEKRKGFSMDIWGVFFTVLEAWWGLPLHILTSGCLK